MRACDACKPCTVHRPKPPPSMQGKMVYCQAFGCRNRSDKHRDKSFHYIPDPKKKPELCKRWIVAIKTTKFDAKTYRFSKDNVICSDHFRDDDFESLLQSRLMTGTKIKPRLKPDAVPSIFSYLPEQKERSADRIARADARKVCVKK